MYKFPDKPIFPELVFVKYIDESKNSERLYKLDWGPKEQYMKDEYDDMIKYSPNPRTKQIVFDKTMFFPHEYIDWLYNLRFKISEYFMEEIVYQAKRGKEEWCRRFPKYHLEGDDSSLNDRTKKFALVHFYTVFELLSDCLYDIEKKERDRDLDFFAKVAMLIYFWEGQTGGAQLLLDSYSGYSKLSEVYSPNNNKWHSDSSIKFVQDFQKLLIEKKTRIEKEHEIILSIPVPIEKFPID
jgi:hypothetical protein